MESNDFIFKVNYKSERYQTIFNNINKIFNSNYLNFISQIKLTHPYLVELFIFLRKYQYFIHYIKIDKQILCLFDSKDNPILERILNIKQMMNKERDTICSIKFELLPKFKKTEINFEIPNDTILFEINLNLRLINEDNKINIELNKGTNINIKNLDIIIDKITLNEINKVLSQIFDLYIEETKEKNFKILNKFINYIENYFPSILPDNLKFKENKNVDSNKTIEEDYWTQGEQNKFEELLIKYKSIKDLKAKLKKISEEFQTKTLKQISSRYKSLALKAKQKKREVVNKVEEKDNNNIENNNNLKQNSIKKEEEAKEDDKEEDKDEEKVKEENLEEEKVKEENKKEEKKEEIKKGKKGDKKIKESKKREKKEDKNEDKIEDNKEDKKEKKEEDKEREKKMEKEKEEEKFDGIEGIENIEKIEKNEIIGDLPSLDLNSKQISSISISSQSSNTDNNKLYNSLETTEDIINAIISVYNKNYKDHDLSLLQENSMENFSFYLNDEDIEEKDSEDDEEEEESDDDNDNNEKIKKKNEELIDLCFSSDFQPTVSSEDLTLIKNILNFGDKYQVNLMGAQINNISIIQISHIKLLLKCSKCKKVAFESKYMKFNKQKNIFYLGTKCPRCQNDIFSIFISDFIHQNNLTNAGVCYITGGNVIDYLPSMYNLECEKCGQSKTIKLRTGCLHSNDANCRKCNTKLNFVILSANITSLNISDLKELADIKIVNFEKYTFAIKDDINLDNYVKKFDKAIQEGKPLPDYGACKHYKYSLRWFRFGCCNKLFPCDVCHDETSDHNCEYAKTILCGFCACEQSQSNKVCSKCGKMFTKSEGGKKFWEGGKGCRNPQFMGTRDSHKYTGLNKTISRKKRKEMQINKKK